MYQIYIKNIKVPLVSFFFYIHSKIWSMYPSSFLCFCLTWTWSWQLRLHAPKEVFLKVQQHIRRLAWKWLKNITKPFSHFIQLHKCCNFLQALLKKCCGRVVSTFMKCFANGCKIYFAVFIRYSFWKMEIIF